MSVDIILLVRQEQDMPSPLRGYEVVGAVNSTEVKGKLKAFVPAVMQKVRETAWKPRPLPSMDGPRPSEESRVTAKLVTLLVVDDERGPRQRLAAILRPEQPGRPVLVPGPRRPCPLLLPAGGRGDQRAADGEAAIELLGSVCPASAGSLRGSFSRSPTGSGPDTRGAPL